MQIIGIVKQNVLHSTIVLNLIELTLIFSRGTLKYSRDIVLREGCGGVVEKEGIFLRRSIFYLYDARQGL